MASISKINVGGTSYDIVPEKTEEVIIGNAIDIVKTIAGGICYVKTKTDSSEGSDNGWAHTKVQVGSSPVKNCNLGVSPAGGGFKAVVGSGFCQDTTGSVNPYIQSVFVRTTGNLEISMERTDKYASSAAAAGAAINFSFSFPIE